MSKRVGKRKASAAVGERDGDGRHGGILAVAQLADAWTDDADGPTANSKPAVKKAANLALAAETARRNRNLKLIS